MSSEVSDVPPLALVQSDTASQNIFVQALLLLLLLLLLLPRRLLFFGDAPAGGGKLQPGRRSVWIHPVVSRSIFATAGSSTLEHSAR